MTDMNGRIAAVEGCVGAGDGRIEIWNAGQLGTRIITKRPGSNLAGESSTGTWGYITEGGECSTGPGECSTGPGEYSTEGGEYST